MKIGDIVAAKFCQEDNYYRAKIISIQVIVLVAILKCMKKCINDMICFRRIHTISVNLQSSFSMLTLGTARRRS